VALPALPPDAAANLGIAVAVGPDGRMAFTATRSPDDSHMLHLADSTGATIARVGPRGEGPGELMLPGFFDFADDGTLLVWDGGTGRITIYASDGTVVSSRQIGQVSAPTALIGDSLDIRAADPNEPFVRQPLSEGRTRELVHPTRLEFDSVFPVASGGGIQSRGMIPYAAGGGRIAFGHPTRNQILVFDDQGRYLGSVGRALPPQFPTAEQLAAESLSLTRQPSVSPAARAGLLQRARTRPIRHLGLRSLHFDGRGRLWVIRAQDGSAVADVYAELALIGTVPLDCPGFSANGSDIRGEWLAMVCRNPDENAPSDATLRLFRILQ